MKAVLNMMHSISYVYEVLRNNIVYKTLKAANSGQILCNATAAIKRSISCTLDVPEDVNFLSDELRVSIVLDGEKKTLGVFHVTTMPCTVDEFGHRTFNVEGYDRSYIVSQKKIEKRSDGFIPSGSNYINVVKQFLLRSGIEDVIIPTADYTIATDREEFEVGTDYLTIINTLLNEINYTSLWFDSEGNACSEPYETPVGKIPQFKYHSGKNSIIMRSHEISNDTFEAYNVFIVGVSNSETSIFKTSVNDDPSSKLSTVNRGRIVAPVVMLDSTATEETAQKHADNLRLKSMLSTETLKIKTGIDRQHEVFDIVEVDLPEAKGKFEEIAWSVSLDASGLMEHTLRRMVFV